MASHSQAATAPEATASKRRYVPVGGRIVPLSVLVAVVAVAAAVFFAWRLYTPPWAGGVQRAEKAPPPADNKVVNAPGPDNQITTLPPAEQRIITTDKPAGKQAPGDRPAPTQEPKK
ncbi:MAG: hypothetical protein K2Q09_05800 [Phycisphaerales bacterium]|nr:hypothetical protein [Phycisphaerales bacterium]